jgi:hypothetical protein
MRISNELTRRNPLFCLFTLIIIFYLPLFGQFAFILTEKVILYQYKSGSWPFIINKAGQKAKVESSCHNQYQCRR